MPSVVEVFGTNAQEKGRVSWSNAITHWLTFFSPVFPCVRHTPTPCIDTGERRYFPLINVTTTRSIQAVTSMGSCQSTIADGRVETPMIKEGPIVHNDGERYFDIFLF